MATFLWKPADTKLKLLIAYDGAIIHEVQALEAFTSYVPNPKGPVFMNFLDKTFGKDQTTRTWEIVKKCVVASEIIRTTCDPEVRMKAVVVIGSGVFDLHTFVVYFFQPQNHVPFRRKPYNQ